MDITTSTSNDWFEKQKGRVVESPCQNCGRLVSIVLPFAGCVFCGDCMTADSGWNDGTEDFYEPRRISDTEHSRLLEEGLNKYSNLWKSLAIVGCCEYGE